MSLFIPAGFAQVVARVRQGHRPRVAVRDLVRWFGFERRGARVNGYIAEAMRQEGVTCTPTLEAVYGDDAVTFASVIPLVVVAPVAPRAPPHPVAVFGTIVGAQADLSRRVHSRLDAIERVVAYLVFAQLAALRDHAGGRHPVAVHEQLREVLPRDGRAGPPLSFGTWVDVARRLAALAPPVADPVFDAGRALTAPRGATPPLVTAIATRVVPLRNRLRHGSNLPADDYRDAEPMFEEVWAALTDALTPLLDCDLVAVHRTEVGAREAYRYQLRKLHGPGPYFGLDTLETSCRLTPGWAHLLRPEGAPLRLAPGVFCVEDGATEAVRLYFCRTLALEACQKVHLLGVVWSDERKEALPA